MPPRTQQPGGAIAGLFVCANTCYNLTGGESGLAADWT